MRKLILSLFCIFLALIFSFLTVACTSSVPVNGSSDTTAQALYDESVTETSVSEFSSITEALGIGESTSAFSKGTTWRAVSDTTVSIGAATPKTSKPATEATVTEPVREYPMSGTTVTEPSLAKDNEIAEITLEIDEIGDGYFTACHVWPSPIKYKVYYDLPSAYLSGDCVDISYYSDSETMTDDMHYEIKKVKKLSNCKTTLNPNMTYKPVIYLYPQAKTLVDVKLDYVGELVETVPQYNDGWTVTAYPDGRLVDGAGTEYPYLFWEGRDSTEYDVSEGFCISGSEAKEFLCEKLSYMGLNDKEIDDFNEFWVPHLEKNSYNRICFQTTVYTDSAKLTVSPVPDSILRIYMVFTPLDSPIDIKEQKLSTFERKGFSVIEWGGGIVR